MLKMTNNCEINIPQLDIESSKKVILMAIVFIVSLLNVIENPTFIRYSVRKIFLRNDEYIIQSNTIRKIYFPPSNKFYIFTLRGRSIIT